MKNLMVDLETLSTSSNAAIVSIGAVWFDPEKALDDGYYQIYETVNIKSCIDAGFDLCGDTIKWWMAQPKEAQSVFNDPNQNTIQKALINLADYIYNVNPNVKVWGNGPSFDNAILANAYRRLNIEQPWMFYNERCYRTLMAMASDMGFKPKIMEKGVPHNALDDAMHQAKNAIAAMNHINRKVIA
jgi:hypothetical protein